MSKHKSAPGAPESDDRGTGDCLTGDAQLAARHVRFGWWSLLVFLSMGIGLETLHAFKVGWYLDALADTQTRRELWNLAHAHGTMLGLVNLGYAFSVAWLNRSDARWRVASPCLLAATLLMPAGFFLGGCFPYSGDPGLGILLVPVGGVLLLVGVLLTALSLKR